MNSLRGSLLVASPSLVDPNFARSVVLVVEHDEAGAFGLILNRPGSIRVAKLWQVLTGETVETRAKAYLGGPVESSIVYLLHSCPDLADDEVEPVVPGVYLGCDQTLFGRLIERQCTLGAAAAGANTDLFRAFCGYAGWGEGQLEEELKTDSWLIQPATAELVLSRNVTGLWSTALEKEGGVFRIFARMPPDPELN